MSAEKPYLCGMKRIILLILVPALLATTACQREIPISDIFVDPTSKTLFVGESFELHIQYIPEDATNTDEIEVYSTNDNIATYSNGTVTAKNAGTAAITASCGNSLDQCRIKVYQYALKKGGKSYGIDYADGYASTMGESSIQAVEIFLIHNDPNGITQNLEFWMRASQFGKDVDFTKDPGDAFVSVFMNNNEDGYTVYMGDDGEPRIKTADWSDTDATLKHGILHVDQGTSNQYKIHVDFELSNGYSFGTDWEGYVNMKID